MIAIKYKEYEKYGCPNCGCDSISEHIKLPKDSSLVRCKNCNLNYFISSDKNPLNVEFEVDGKFEQPQLIVHPRKKSELEKWSKPNLYIRPNISEYYYIDCEVCIPLTITDNREELIVEVTSEISAKNIINMIKSVLGVEECYSNYSVEDYNKILVSFNQYEFDIVKLLEFLVCTNYITSELLTRTKKNDQVYLDQLLLVNRFSTLYLGVPYIPKSNIMEIGKSYYIHSMNEVIYIVDINEEEISFTKLPKMTDYDDIYPTIIKQVPYFELSMKDVEIKPFEIDKYLKSRGTISADENGNRISLSAAEILALSNNFYFNKDQISSINEKYLRELLDTSSYSRYILHLYSNYVFLLKISE